MISRVQCELTDEVIERIAAPWPRGAVKPRGRRVCSDTPVSGYCRSVTLAEIAEHGHVLTPGRYVGAEAVEDDDEGFADQDADADREAG
jgi:type I restriction enzyme M protein